MKAEQKENKTKIKEELEMLVVRHFIYCRRGEGGGEKGKFITLKIFRHFLFDVSVKACWGKYGKMNTLMWWEMAYLSTHQRK